MTTPVMTPATLEDAARATVCEVLNTQRAGMTAVRVDSPPGAGKTALVERLAVQSREILGERCMVATQTNEQAFDLARRLATGFPRIPICLFARRELAIPLDLLNHPALCVVRDITAVPGGPCIVISNAAKWSWVTQANVRFDCQIVDEAFQLPDFRFQQIAGLADRVVLIGDPGQIAPLINCEIDRWRCDKAGPQVACPRALEARHPGIQRLALPVSRRLVPDTVDVIQPAFYSELPFSALTRRGERRLVVADSGHEHVDRVIDPIVRGASIVQAELPPRLTGEVDADLAEVAVSITARMLARGASVIYGADMTPLTPRMIGIVCAHVSQVNAIRERMPRPFDAVLVETADRFQGLEREVMIVHHPLSGRADASEFHLDAGRMCVMLTRHRTACVLLARRGVAELLTQYAPSGNRVLGLDADAEFEGWRAHRSVMAALARASCIVELPDR